MNAKEIIEGNCLLAIFTGHKMYMFRGYRMFIFDEEGEEENNRTELDLHYDNSWWWLMEVINKCRETNIVNHDKLMDALNNALYLTDISLAYKGCLDFVKLYNEQVK